MAVGETEVFSQQHISRLAWRNAFGFVKCPFGKFGDCCCPSSRRAVDSRYAELFYVVTVGNKIVCLLSVRVLALYIINAIAIAICPCSNALSIEYKLLASVEHRHLSEVVNLLVVKY